MSASRRGATAAAAVLVLLATPGESLRAGQLEEAMARLRASRVEAAAPDPAAAEAGLQEDLTVEAMPADVPGTSVVPGEAATVHPKRRRRLRHLRVTLDSVPLRAEEDQSAAKPNSFLTVGRRIDTSVSFLPGGSIRENSEEKAAAMAVFLGQPALHIYGVRIRALSYTGTTGMRMDGKTPPMGRVEVYQVREVGDVRGKVVKTVEGVSFRLGGKETVIPLDLPVEPKYRYMCVFTMDAPEGVSSSINVPVAAEGTYTALALDPKNLIPEQGGKPSYDAAVHFEFKPDPDVVRPHFEIQGEFIQDLERFLDEHPEASEIPLKLLLE